MKNIFYTILVLLAALLLLQGCSSQADEEEGPQPFGDNDVDELVIGEGSDGSIQEQEEISEDNDENLDTDSFE